MVYYRVRRIIISNLKEINSGDPMLLVLWESDTSLDKVNSYDEENQNFPLH